jgi:hypothetical protein
MLGIMKTKLITVALCAVLGSFVVQQLNARTSQEPKIEFPQASPASTLKQRVGLTDIEVTYSRPSVKGRKIFGDLVPFDQVWRTGANNATKLSFSTDVKFGGADVPAGDYALFTIPSTGEWTVILSTVTGVWGSYAYDQKDDLVRIKVKPQALSDSVETMTIDLSNLRDDSAVLALSWEKTRVAVQLETNLLKVLLPQIDAAMASNGPKPYFEAAMFYYAHDLDLKKASGWIDEAIKAKPDALWIIYRKGLILAKLGDKPGAMAAAKQSLEMATKAGGSLGAEYKHLNEMLIASLR